MRLCCCLLLIFPFCSSQKQTEKYCLIGSVLKNEQFHEIVAPKTVDDSCDCSFTVECKEAKCYTIKNVFFQCDPIGTSSSSSYKSNQMYISYNKTECETANMKCNETIFRNLHNEYKTLLWGLKYDEDQENLRATWRAGIYSIIRRDSGGRGKVVIHDHTPWLFWVFGGVLTLTSGVPAFYILFIEKTKHNHEDRDFTPPTPNVSRETEEPPVKPMEISDFYKKDK